MATTSNTYTGNGSTVDFSFTFPYLKSSDIKVSVDEVVQSLTTHYTLHNATTIRFGTAPGSGKSVKVYRDTGSAELAATFYPGSAIRSSDLNDTIHRIFTLLKKQRMIPLKLLVTLGFLKVGLTFLLLLKLHLL